MHKEAPLTKNQKEDIRHRNMHDRDNFDCNNLGGFRRSFPTPNCVSIVLVIRSGLKDWQTELKPFMQCGRFCYLGSTNEVWISAWGVKGTLERIHERSKASRSVTSDLLKSIHKLCRIYLFHCKDKSYWQQQGQGFWPGQPVTEIACLPQPCQQLSILEQAKM